ncbi:MAG: phosphotransferase [Anaerolineaceae bacterium]|nr:phosphotransferase [Anaerolineaceae bacterium]
MEQRIKDLFNEDILHEAMQRYGIVKDEIHILDSFESFIYEFKNKTGEYILRISHSIRRDEALIHGEVDWINYLADHGISVARSILSLHGNLVETIPDQNVGYFLATAFVKAAGTPPWGRWTPNLFESYGELIGQMHALTNQFQPLQPERKRPEWDNPIFDYVEQYLPESVFLIREKYKAVCMHVNKLPKNPETYGLVHQDAHGSNLFIDDQGKITLFDFDDCGYNWFINDIAIVLFYMVASSTEKAALTREFMSHFLKGYLHYFPLDLDLLKEIPYFLKMREIELYAVIQRDFDLDNIEDSWAMRFMHNRKINIENDVPFIDLDFNSLKLLF